MVIFIWIDLSRIVEISRVINPITLCGVRFWPAVRWISSTYLVFESHFQYSCDRSSHIAEFSSNRGDLAARWLRLRATSSLRRKCRALLSRYVGHSFHSSFSALNSVFSALLFRVSNFFHLHSNPEYNVLRKRVWAQHRSAVLVAPLSGR